MAKMTVDDALGIVDFQTKTHPGFDSLTDAAEVLAAEVRRVPRELDHERHEENAKAFVAKVMTIMVDAMKLSPEAAPDVFSRVADLRRELRGLFEQNSYLATREAKAKLYRDLSELAKKVY